METTHDVTFDDLTKPRQPLTDDEVKEKEEEEKEEEEEEEE